MMLRILVAGSSGAVREGLEVSLADAGCEVFCAPDAARAQAVAEEAAPDVILWGLPEDPEAPGPGAIARLLPDAYLVALGDGDPDALAERVVCRGFGDQLALPCSEATLALLIHRASRWCRNRRELRVLRHDVEKTIGDRPIVGASPAMIELLEALERAAGFRANVLLKGERGTGKEGLARAIHAQSERRRGPFVTLRCRELATAGTAPEVSDGFVAADGGTLFLDDVEGLPRSIQERLLAALETEEIARDESDKPRRVDVRIVAATCVELPSRVAAGEFHPELATRIAALELAVPALRDRAHDIPLLVDHFFARACRELGKPLRNLTDDALERLVEYAWPGNVRELANVVERAVMLAPGDQVSGRELPDRLDAAAAARDGDLGLRRGRKRLEVELIRRALRQTGGNRTHAAKRLEISHRALLYKLKEHGI